MEIFDKRIKNIKFWPYGTPRFKYLLLRVSSSSSSSEGKMSRRYDQSTTTFSPEGRLHQVEYAIEAINNAGTCIGLNSQEGVVLCAEKRVVSKLLAPSKTSEKTYTIDNHVVCLVAGLTADANILIQNARTMAQR